MIPITISSHIARTVITINNTIAAGLIAVQGKNDSSNSEPAASQGSHLSLPAPVLVIIVIASICVFVGLYHIMVYRFPFGGHVNLRIPRLLLCPPSGIEELCAEMTERSVRLPLPVTRIRSVSVSGKATHIVESDLPTNL
ncbi:hypothetical protein AN958_02107 [Leucoagaricus sp. SymC.cos]|nr:hypothetical protein AN958_02107 [Leucoagaricus sp. SymC.cos]